MKTFTKIIFSIFILSISINAYGISYVSAGAGPSTWSDPNTWSPVGTPTNADDVTISAGHTVNIATSVNNCKNLTVDGTLNWTANYAVNIYGDYVLTGAETSTGYGKIQFYGAGTSLSVTGTSNPKIYYNFQANRTILAGSVINKLSSTTQLAANKTLTNLGTLTLAAFTPGAGSTFTNGATGTVSIKAAGFMTGKTFNAHAVGNTVILRYATGALPTTTAGFYNLTLAATTAGTKTLSTNTIIANNLVINTNNTLNSNNFDLSVGGNWTSNGTFTASAGKTVTFNGTSAGQNISNTIGTTTFKGLTINNANGVTLTTGTYVLDEVITITDGTFNTGGRPFTMTSNATQTARIAPISGTGAIAGNFTIQRFISGRDTTYCDLTSPVQFSTFADWESELLFVNYVSSPPTSEASASTYDEAADTYVPVTSSGTALNAGVGYEVYLSGAGYAAFPATTLNTVGTPNQGDFDLTSLISNAVQGWNLVGNPFASSISWASVYGDAGTSGLYDYIEMYDYTIGDWNGFTTADGIEIGSTQGFWVYGLPGNGAVSLNIPESSKTTSSNSSIKTLEKPQPYFILNMASNTSKNAHNFKVSGSSGLDIPFRPSPDKATPEMYCMIDGKKINIHNFNSSTENYSIPLKTKVNVSGKYTITASGFDFVSEYTCVKLEDKLTGQIIDLKDGNGYCFTMNANDYPDRFVLTFSKDASCRTATVASSPNTDFNNQVEVLPSAQGNVINFNLSETTNTNISIINVLGQTIVESVNVAASTQSINVALPEGFSGLYFVKIESSKGTITKKFVRK